MSRNSVRTVLCVLVVLCVLSAAPLQAKPARVAGKGTATVSSEAFAYLWERVASLLGRNVPVEKEGVTIDPDGVTAPSTPARETDEGASIDPDGRP